MPLVVDPFNEDVAITVDGEVLHALRFLPISDDGIPPTAEELSQAPIMGYGQLIASEDDP